MKLVMDSFPSSQHKTCAALTIQNLADSGITDWQTAYQQHIKNAKKLGRMPDDPAVIRETLQHFGFAMQSAALEACHVSTVFSKLGHFSVPAVVFLQLSDFHYQGGYMAAVYATGDTYVSVATFPIADPLDHRWVNHVWIRWDDGIDRSPYPRRGVKRRKISSSPKRDLSETPYFKPFQPNPCGNYISDCVVRAVAGVLDISWGKAVDLLAAMQETTINSRKVYPAVLEQQGLIHHSPLCVGGRHLDGKTFCEKMNQTYHNGERIVAHVGRLHLAAIVPVAGADGKSSYKIIDSWDSSARLIGEYWVLPAKSYLP